MAHYAEMKDPGLGEVLGYKAVWDAHMLHGCVCDDGYHGSDCSLRYCPVGDDPLTGVGADVLSNPTQVNTIQSVTCKAGGGYFTLAFRGKFSPNIPYNALGTEVATSIQGIASLGPASVKVRLLGPQACSDSGAHFTVEFTQHFGLIPLLVPSARFLSFSDAINTPNISVALTQAGTKESEPCSNRGVCDETTGVCACEPDYYTSDGYNRPGSRGDCGYTDETILYCPGILTCSAHGQCSGGPTYRCSCADGWAGADCSERACPRDVSWFALPSASNEAHLYESAECSDMGRCDRSSGACLCEAGFTGAACQRTTCPGGTASPTLDEEACSGNGKCYDVQTLASYATVNGDAAGFTYGLVPNNPLTWDANKVFGCLCDARHGGYACAESLCPTGHNPELAGAAYVDEGQIVACTDADATGGVVLHFRTHDSARLAADATAADVRAALEGVPGVGEVAVVLFDPLAVDSLCSAGGSQLLVTFLTAHGDLPLMTATSTDVDSVTITEYVKGSKRSDVCSGRGLCDTETGQCECFEGYGSSDGKGGAGTRNDCGWVSPVTLPLLNG